ncbi:MAG: 4-hydroxy-tetrahydrodipicolinate reductase [Oscillospiraceae bacterium]|jgi:4-hydroxy-tetrahydrodipicolinate reductase|nr:4-hydroxy-tetrahydrodipicolinate reductase [Oscillospiraceae bacterium]
MAKSVALIGYGRMGRALENCIAESADWSVAGVVDPARLPSLRDVESADVAIDFSFPGDIKGLLEVALLRGIPLVIGRTGLDEAAQVRIRQAAESLPIVQDSNFSIGVAVMRRAVRLAAAALPAADVEIIEAHHADKEDAPSGTAQRLLSDIDPSGQRPIAHGRQGARNPGEIGLHALRGGTTFGEHQVIFFAPMERLSIAHSAEDRRVFALGALRAAAFVIGQPPGLYTMEQVLFGEKGGGA